ncbi:hypothetical protein D3C71_1082750 [compost metagenome]
MYALVHQRFGGFVAISGAAFNQQRLVCTGQLNIAPVTRNARATFLLRPALQRFAPLLECSQSPSITGKACSGSRSTPELSPILKHDPCPFVVHVGHPLRRFLGSDLPGQAFVSCTRCRALAYLGAEEGFLTWRAPSSPSHACGLNVSFFLHTCTRLKQAQVGGCVRECGAEKACRSMGQHEKPEAPKGRVQAEVHLLFVRANTQTDPNMHAAAFFKPCAARQFKAAAIKGISYLDCKKNARVVS